jgi:hypothetical protein
MRVSQEAHTARDVNPSGGRPTFADPWFAACRFNAARALAPKLLKNLEVPYPSTLTSAMAPNQADSSVTYTVLGQSGSLFL